MLQEFKDFINKGGVFEAAVGLILALAFAPIVNSMVADVIMPIVGRNLRCSRLRRTSRSASEAKSARSIEATGLEVCEEAAIRYGAFIAHRHFVRLDRRS